MKSICPAEVSEIGRIFSRTHVTHGTVKTGTELKKLFLVKKEKADIKSRKPVWPCDCSVGLLLFSMSQFSYYVAPELRFHVAPFFLCFKDLNMVNGWIAPLEQFTAGKLKHLKAGSIFVIELLLYSSSFFQILGPGFFSCRPFFFQLPAY